MKMYAYNRLAMLNINNTLFHVPKIINSIYSFLYLINSNQVLFNFNKNPLHLKNYI